MIDGSGFQSRSFSTSCFQEQGKAPEVPPAQPWLTEASNGRLDFFPLPPPPVTDRGSVWGFFCPSIKECRGFRSTLRGKRGPHSEGRCRPRLSPIDAVSPMFLSLLFPPLRSRSPPTSHTVHAQSLPQIRDSRSRSCLSFHVLRIIIYKNSPGIWRETLKNVENEKCTL